MRYFKGLVDDSIPATQEALAEEELLLKQSDDSESVAREDFLVHIGDITRLRNDITLSDLQGLTPDEIYDLLYVVNDEIGTGISDLVEILKGARKQLKDIIVFKVLGLNKEDLK